MPHDPNLDIYRRPYTIASLADVCGFGLSATDSVKAFGACDITSLEMQCAIKEWFAMYFNTHACCKIDTGMRLPYNIVDTLTKATFGEFEYNVDDSHQEQHIKQSVDDMESVREQSFQFGLIGGESYIKIVPDQNNQKFTFRVIRRDAVSILGRDFKGNITSIGMFEKRERDNMFYTLCEKRSLDVEGYLTIEYKLFESRIDWCASGDLGGEVDLYLFEDYANLSGLYRTTQPVDTLGLIPVSMPMVNTVDGSKEPVSLYSAAMKEIICSYHHAERMNWEYNATRPKLVVTDDIVQRDKRGRAIELPDYIEAIDTTSTDSALSIYNPTPHQEQLEARMNQHLRTIENLCGLRRGQFSNVDSEDRTATEVLTSTARYALTIKCMQNMWKNTMNEAIRIIATFGNIYFGWGYNLEELPEISIAWGNGVLYDEEKEFRRAYDAAIDGIIKPEVIAAWILNKDLDLTDPQSVADIRALMPSITNTESMGTIIG